MDITGLSLTTITLFIPMVGLAILLFMNGETHKNNVKWVAFGTSIVAFVASVLMWVNFDPSLADLQMVQRNTWAEVSLGASSVNISYFVGVDGISMLLVLLTTFIMPIAILSSFGSHIFHVARMGDDRCICYSRSHHFLCLLGSYAGSDVFPHWYLGCGTTCLCGCEVLPLYDGWLDFDAPRDFVCR